MQGTFRAQKVTDRVYWVGAIDWAIRNFHGYSTDQGTTYNAYLILGDKVILIDTVKLPFKDEMLSRISSVVDPGEIEYIVSNHSEMDHSGCLPQMIQAVRPEKVFASQKGAEALQLHFGLGDRIVAVKDGERTAVGDADLLFMETRMLHWPDSMFTYLSGDDLLFSQDAFGMHLASTQRFTDELSNDVLEREAAKYYANILLPFSPLVGPLLKKIDGLGLPIAVIAPDHGPIWREDLEKPLQLYSEWASQAPTNKVVVMYDTMWQSTARMASAIAEGITAGGGVAKLAPLEGSHRSDVATEILDAGGLLAGSPTMNNNIYPTIADALTYLKGLKPRNLVGAAFGSYGWSGEAVGQIEDALRAMKVELVGESLRVRYVPDEAALGECRSLGMKVARALEEVLDNAR